MNNKYGWWAKLEHTQPQLGQRVLVYTTGKSIKLAVYLGQEDNTYWSEVNRGPMDIPEYWQPLPGVKEILTESFTAEYSKYEDTEKEPLMNERWTKSSNLAPPQKSRILGYTTGGRVELLNSREVDKLWWSFERRTAVAMPEYWQPLPNTPYIEEEKSSLEHERIVRDIKYCNLRLDECNKDTEQYRKKIEKFKQAILSEERKTFNYSARKAELEKSL